MKKNERITLCSGIILTAVFAVWTLLVQTIDVQPAGQNGTDIGFASFNCWFHRLTGVNMTFYYITDWLGLVPLFVCMIFGAVGFVQLIKRRALMKVDHDILILGVYYVMVIFCYVAFEMIPVNYRPVLIDGYMEASYPSSTTLLVLSVMPTLVFQCRRRVRNKAVRCAVIVISALFSVFMITGRLLSGVHWFTDIVGSVILSAGLFLIYKAVVLMHCRKAGNPEVM